MHESLARPLNPLLDLYLARSLVDLLTETLGDLLGWLCLAALALVPLLVGIGAFALVRMAQRALDRPWARRATLATCGALLALFALQEMRPQALRAGPTGVEPREPDAAPAMACGARRPMAGHGGVRERDRRGPRSGSCLRSACSGELDGADVLLMFVESYGRSALEQPRYADTLLPTLATFEQRLAERGLFAASGWLTSPTVGGQSWLAHGTLESGLWLADQARYEVLIQSERLTLTRAFAKAGYRTVALKPAITRPWPEGERLGFARIYAAADLGYAGKPYNWVTMPDQYTLAVLERAERAGRGAAVVRRGLADQQPCALDADRAGARGLVGDRRRPRVLALGRRRRPARGGLA